MELKDILALPKIEDRIALLTTDRTKQEKDKKIDQWLDEYNGKHEILKKPDKTVGDKESGTLKTVKTAKEVVTLQKKIVSSAVFFLLGKPVQLILANEDEQSKKAFDALNAVLDDNKIGYFNKKLARRVFSETAAAELWYVRPVRKLNPVTGKVETRNVLKVMLLSKRDGSNIYPLFDSTGDLVAFTRKYKTDELTDQGSVAEIDHVDVYTAEKHYYYTKKTGETTWSEATEDNRFGKITVIYYEQEAPEWNDVQILIDRLEAKMSSHADTNDYFDSPILKVWGNIAKMPGKTEDGKILQFKSETGPNGQTVKGGDADYVSWSQSPESMKLEYENLKYFILFLTDTPDIGFDNMKNLGVMSGAAIRLMFLAAICKAMDKEEIFGSGFTRRINLLKTMLGAMDLKSNDTLASLKIDISFSDPLPESADELIKTLTEAVGGESIMSQETAVRRNPLVDDPNAELEKLKSEREERQQALAEAATSYEL